MNVKKAVIPVAGKGTRFLPATKNIPKEMIPLVDRPMIHYVVEEAVRSGIESIIFVTARGKSSIEDYFDREMELESFLTSQKKEIECKMIHDIGTMIAVSSVRQKQQKGLGHAVLCARELVGNEPFAVLLGDDLVIGANPATRQLIDVFNGQQASGVIGVMEVPREDTAKYGIVAGDFIDNKNCTLKMTKMVEKPKPHEAPTLLATPGRYVFSPKIFDYLEKIPLGVGGEYQLTDAINLMAQDLGVFAHKFQGDRFDTGNVDAYLEATVEFALRSPRYSNTMKKVILDRINKYEIR